MAKKKQEEAPKGSPAWMATFSDLMNLLLCFFVLLFSMSTVDAEKFQQVIASLQNSISILPSGGSSVGEGQMISSGVRQLEFLDSYYKEMSNSEADTENDKKGSISEQYEQMELEESEYVKKENDYIYNKKLFSMYGLIIEARHYEGYPADWIAKVINDVQSLNGTNLFASVHSARV